MTLFLALFVWFSLQGAEKRGAMQIVVDEVI